MMSRNAALLIAFGFAALVSSTAAQAVGYYDYGRYNKPIVTYSDAARVVDRDLSYQSDLLALSAPTAPGRRFVRKQAKDLQLIETYLDSEAEKEKEKRKDHSHGRRTLKQASVYDQLAAAAKSQLKLEEGVLAKVDPSSAAGARARHAESQRVKKIKSIEKEYKEKAALEREKQDCSNKYQERQRRLKNGEPPQSIPATTARCKQLLGLP